MMVAAVVSDLMIFSRIESAAGAAGAALVRLDDPSELPPNVDLVLVDWSARASSWVAPLVAARHAGSRLVLFGPHVDLDAHAAARASGLGPMRARSSLVKLLARELARVSA